MWHRVIKILGNIHNILVLGYFTMEWMGKGGESPLLHLSQLTWISPGFQNENALKQLHSQPVDSDFAEE